MVQKGMLVVVGTGLHLGQITQEAQSWIAKAETLFYLVENPLTLQWLLRQHPHALDLQVHYGEGKDRRLSYAAMIEQMLGAVREDKLVVVALYGHPGEYAYPARMTIKRAREEGYQAFMCPGISASANLFAHLLVDPGNPGIQSLEATRFLAYNMQLNTNLATLLWQVGCLGNLGYFPSTYALPLFPQFIERLLRFFPPDHPALLYIAPNLPGLPPQVTAVTIATLTPDLVKPIHTLYLPPYPQENAEPEILMVIDQSIVL